MAEPHLVDINSEEFEDAVIRAIAKLHTSTAHNRQWYKTSDACTRLGFPSSTALIKWKNKMGKNLREGHHYRKIGGANTKRHNYEFHVKNCEELKSTERRKLR